MPKFSNVKYRLISRNCTKTSASVRNNCIKRISYISDQIFHPVCDT